MPVCERHGEGADPGREYTVIGMAYWFHNWPHVKYSLQKIDNDMFDFFSRQYVTSLAVLAALVLIICLIFLIIYFIFSYVVCICHSDDSEDSGKSKGHNKDGNKKLRKKEDEGISKGWKRFIFCVSILFLFSFFIAFFGAWKVYLGASSLKNSTRDAQKWFMSIRQDFDEIQFIRANDIKSITDALREQLSSFIFMETIVNKFFGFIDSIIVIANKTNEEVIKANLPLVNLSTVDIDWVDDVETYGNLVWIGSFVGVFAVTFVGLIFTCGVFSSSVLSVFTIIGILGLIMTSFLVALGVSATVFVSDFCMDAKPFIKREIDDILIYTYIVECPITSKKWAVTKSLDAAKSLLESFESAYREITSGIATIIDTYCRKTMFINKAVNKGVSLLQKLVPFGLADAINPNMNITCPFNISNRINSTLARLGGQLNTYTQLVYAIQRIANCLRIHKDLYDSLESLCNDINTGAVILHFYSIFALISLFVIVFCSTYALSQRPTGVQKQIQSAIRRATLSKPKKKIVNKPNKDKPKDQIKGQTKGQTMT